MEQKLIKKPTFEDNQSPTVHSGTQTMQNLSGDTGWQPTKTLQVGTQMLNEFLNHTAAWMNAKKGKRLLSQTGLLNNPETGFRGTTISRGGWGV